MSSPYERSCLDAPVVWLCALACFPYSYFKQIHNWGDKISVLVRGAAVVISPTVGALSLWAYATVIFGKWPVVMLLPGIALLIDWRTVASGYGDANINNFWIWVLRIGLACISLFIAGYVSLLGEQENLKKDLARQERQQAIQNPAISEEYKLITKRIEDHQRAIAENQLRIQGRAVLVQEKVLKTKLEDKECNGAAGLDEATGVNIAGGHRCGGKATNHRLDAAAAQAQIGEIDTLPAKNDQLKLEITDAEKQREALIAPFLSDPGSMGSLIKSAEYADFGVQVQIFGKLIILMILELFALILAHVVAPQLTVVSNERG